jgi:acetolactate synthase-1/2/3 large subunit/5-guanidino-2-oxopentanoate decarboxylase
VAYVITGPGVCNIMTPMGQAYSDSVPMLVISSCLDETSARRGQLHQMKDQRGAAETVCDWSEEARTAEAAYTLIDRAMLEFETQRQRPKHIQVPISVLENLAMPASAGTPHLDLDTSDSYEPSVDRISASLAQAQRPILVFGGGAAHSAYAQDHAAKVMNKFGAAAFTTYAGRGVVPADHPLYFGSCLARPDSAAIFAQADLVIAFGTSLDEVDVWRDHLGHNCPLIRVDIAPEVLVDKNTNGMKILAQADVVLAHLLDSTETSVKTSWTATEVATIRARWRAELDAERPGILPVCDALREAVPADTMIYSDMTQIAYTAKEVWDMDRPGHWHHPYGFGTLGYATPAAIGGAVARKGKPTMAIIGDYGFHYTMAELGVAVELGLSLPIILWDNTKLGEIEDSMIRAQIAPNAVIARNPDFCKLAEAFGAYAKAPKTLEDLQRDVKAAFNTDGPTLIYVTPEIKSAAS